MPVLRPIAALPAALLVLGVACGTETTNPPPGGDDTTPAAIAVTSGNGQTGTAGSVLAAPFVATVSNADGDPLDDVSVNWSVTAGGGSLSVASSTTDAQGQASVTLTLGAAAGANSVRATVASTSLTADFSATATAPPVDNTPATILAQSGNNQSGTVGTELAAPLVARVRNASNQGLANVTVEWLVTQGGGNLGSATSTTNSAGDASTTYTLGGTPGANTVMARVQSNTAINVPFNATGNAAVPAAGVTVEDSQFVPPSVGVSVGGTVTWTWAGTLAHNITWVSGGFANAGDRSSGTHQVTFPSPGSFAYYCSIHGSPGAGMRGTVTVN